MNTPDSTIQPLNDPTPAPPPSELLNSQTPELSNSPTPPSLTPLRNLPGEQPHAFHAFFEWAHNPGQTLASISGICGRTERTVQRWKRTFNWDQRLADYHNAKNPAPPPPQRPSPAALAAMHEERAQQCNFRSKALALALSAIERWQHSDDGIINLSGVARLVEMALKITDPASSSAANPAASAYYTDFMAAMDKVYGADALQNPVPTTQATAPTAPDSTAKMSGNVGSAKI